MPQALPPRPRPAQERADARHPIPRRSMATHGLGPPPAWNPGSTAATRPYPLYNPTPARTAAELRQRARTDALYKAYRSAVSAGPAQLTPKDIGAVLNYVDTTLPKLADSLKHNPDGAAMWYLSEDITSLKVPLVLYKNGQTLLDLPKEAPLGHGAYKRVNKAIDLKTTKAVAHIRNRRPGTRDEPLDDMHAELSIYRKLGGAKGIPKIRNWGQWQGREGRHMSMVQDLYKGDLRHRGPKLSTRQRRMTLAVSLVEALNSLHEAGYAHCDIKPDNILVGDDDRGVLADFGLTTKTIRTYIGCTATHEHPKVRERRAGGRSLVRSLDEAQQFDVYSLGVTLTELLSPQQGQAVVEANTQAHYAVQGALQQRNPFRAHYAAMQARRASLELHAKEKTSFDRHGALIEHKLAHHMRNPEASQIHPIRDYMEAFQQVAYDAWGVGTNPQAAHAKPETAQR